MSKDMALMILMIDQLIVWVVTTAIGAMNNSSVRVFELLGELHVVCNLTRAYSLSNGRQAGCNQGA
jgi:lipoprotein signal peptidase